MAFKSMKDAALYRKLCEPFPSLDAAHKAVQAFHADVRAAREKHKIPDVVVVCRVNFLADGEEIDGSEYFSNGSSELVLPLLAHAYGREQERHQQSIAAAATPRKL